jgi:C4-dicarboxylate-specific signal transduction histidine kinase
MKHIHRLFYPPAWLIAAKVSAALLAATLIPMSFNAYYNLQQGLKSAEAAEYRQLELLATTVASRLDRLIIDVRHLVIYISTHQKAIAFFNVTTVEERKVITTDLQELLDNIFQANSLYDAIYLVDERGNCVASTNSAFVGENYSFQEYFRQAKQGTVYTSSILIEKNTGRPALYLSNPVRAKNGKIIGVAIIKIKEEEIAKIFNGLGLDTKSDVFLIDQMGIIISHRDRSLLYHSLGTLSWKTQQQIKIERRYHLKKINNLNLNNLTAAMVGATEAGHISDESPAEKRFQRVGFAPLKVEPWVLGVSRPETVFAAPLRHIIWQYIISLLIISAIASFWVIILARSITRPICELTKAAKAVKKGNFNSARLTQFSHKQDDIGQLVRVFIQMAHQIQIREDRLKQQVRPLNFEIDEAKRESQVAAVTGTEYFQQLQQKAHQLRQQLPKNNEAQY